MAYASLPSGAYVFDEVAHPETRVIAAITKNIFFINYHLVFDVKDDISVNKFSPYIAALLLTGSLIR